MSAAGRVRFLSYLKSTKRRYETWMLSGVGLSGMIVNNEAALVEQAHQRWGRPGQLNSAHVPLDVLLGVLAFLPPPNIDNPGLPIGPDAWRMRQQTIPRCLCANSTMLFLILENAYVKNPSMAPRPVIHPVIGGPQSRPSSDASKSETQSDDSEELTEELTEELPRRRKAPRMMRRMS